MLCCFDMLLWLRYFVSDNLLLCSFLISVFLGLSLGEWHVRVLTDCWQQSNVIDHLAGWAKFQARNQLYSLSGLS